MPLLFDSSAKNSVSTQRTSFSGADIRAIMHRPGYRIENAAKEHDAYPNAEGQVQEFGSIQTLSVSTFREKNPVRSLGFQNVMGYTRGNRTVGGRLIFALLDTHPFNDNGFNPHAESTPGKSGILRSTSGVLDAHVFLDDLFADVEEDNFTTPARKGTEVIIGRKHQYDFTWDSQLFGELMFPDEMPPFDIIVTFVNEAGGAGKIVLHGVDIMGESMVLSIEDLFTEVQYDYVARGMSMFEEGSFKGRLWGGPTRPFADDWALGQLNKGSE